MSSQALTQLVRVLAGLRQFLIQHRGTETLELLLFDEIGGIFYVDIVKFPRSISVINFSLRDTEGNECRCSCNPSGFALLLLIIVCGQSVFIDYSDNRPYVKVFGRKNKSAGTVFSRLLFEAEAGENCKYANGNTLDLTFTNIEYGGKNRRTTNEMVGNYGEMLSAAVNSPAALFPGSPEDKVSAATQLSKSAFDRIAEEREAAFAV